MNIHPPQVSIDGNKPFDNALFGRKQFAESLTALLRNVTENLVIFVHAPWGEGKTTFAQMWRAYLRTLKLDAVYFDAYAADHADDAFISFSSEILALVDERFAKVTGVQKPRREFKKTAIKVGKRLAGLVTEVGIRAATLGALEATHVKELKEIGSEVASGVSKIGSEVVEEQIESYTLKKDSLREFRQSLAALAKVVREQQGFPLTIIVDELDRCRPDFALALLERIKHLFDVEGVAFILLVNRQQIESYIRKVYGTEVDARAYLLKFGSLFVDLPTQAPESHHEPEHADYCKTLLAHHKLSDKVGDTRHLLECIELFVVQFGLTLREIERVFALLVLYYASLGKERTDAFLIAMLSTLKVKRPLLYQKLKTNTIAFTEFMNETGLASFKKRSPGINEIFFKAALKYLLLPDLEAGRLARGETSDEHGTSVIQQVASDYGTGDSRKRWIPYLCMRLDRFSFRP